MCGTSFSVPQCARSLRGPVFHKRADQATKGQDAFATWSRRIPGRHGHQGRGRSRGSALVLCSYVVRSRFRSPTVFRSAPAPLLLRPRRALGRRARPDRPRHARDRPADRGRVLAPDRAGHDPRPARPDPPRRSTVPAPTSLATRSAGRTSTRPTCSTSSCPTRATPAGA